MTVGNSNFPSNTGAPTPLSLVVFQDIDFGSATFTTINPGGPPILTVVHISHQFPNGGIGTYKVNYVSGLISLVNTGLPLLCPGITNWLNEFWTGAVGAPPAQTLLSTSIVPNTVFVVPPLFFVSGQYCNYCELLGPPCDTGAMIAATLAGNPNGVFTLPSATYGESLPTVPLSGWLVYDYNPAFTTFSGGLTQQLIQTSHFSPQPQCVQIRDFATVKAQILGSMAGCPAFATLTDYCAQFGGFFCQNIETQEWDGTFPHLKVYFPQAPDQQSGNYINNLAAVLADGAYFTMGPLVLATTIIYESAVQYRNVAGVAYWELRIIAYLESPGYIRTVWLGRKTTGTDPTGTYEFDHTSDACATAPATICIDPCGAIPPVQNPNNITTPQLLYGSAAYAPAP